MTNDRKLPDTKAGEPISGPRADALRQAGLRPTRQRLAIADVLFGQGDRHVSAEVLRDEVIASGHSISLATIYNALHQFTRAGLLRELAIDGTTTYFDTNVSNHSHFFVEETNEVLDIPGDQLQVTRLPSAPEGMRISHVDVVVRITKAG